jgi:hypothetical protein
LDAALRELIEEAGIPTHTVTPPATVHIDIHRIPANQAKGEPDHQHIDSRSLFHATAEVGRLRTEEVTDAAWRDAESLNGQVLWLRIGQALR